MVTWCHRPIDGLAGGLTADEQKHLADIYRVYCLPYVISLPEYEAKVYHSKISALPIGQLLLHRFWNGD